MYVQGTLLPLVHEGVRGRGALEGQKGLKGRFKNGCESSYWWSEESLGGDLWRVHTSCDRTEAVGRAHQGYVRTADNHESWVLFKWHNRWHGSQLGSTNVW